MPLDARRTAKAVKYNAKKAGKIGWADFYPQILETLGLSHHGLRPEVFAGAVADWQATVPISDDGKIGPGTWGHLEPLCQFSIAPLSLPAWLKPSWSARKEFAPAPAIGGGPAWFQVAEAQRQGWNDEITGWADVGMASNAERHTEMDEMYFKATPFFGGSVNVQGATPGKGRIRDWCSAFVNYCLHRAGVSHTGSALAGSFVKEDRWHFDALEEPRVGCVIVTGNSSPAHVGFLADFKGLPTNPGGNVHNGHKVRISLLGGNQSGRVSISSDGRNLFSAPGRNGIRSPYLWPLAGPANCAVDLPSAGPHFCGHIHKE